MEANAHYFAKTKTNDKSRADYFVPSKILASHSAVKLPANGDSKWQAVGANVTVDLGPAGNWHTCNYGASVPEEVGTKCVWYEATRLNGIPDTENNLIDLCLKADWTWLPIHGTEGVVVQNSSGFMFLPKTDQDKGVYWSWTEASAGEAYALRFEYDYYTPYDFQVKVFNELAVRLLAN